MPPPPRLEALFRRVVALRAPILALFALVVPAAAWRAAHIPSEAGIDRLISPSDPDHASTKAFQRIFPEGQVVLLLLEAEDPYRPEVLAAADALAGALRAIPGASVYSAQDVYRRAHPGFRPTAEGAAAFRLFAEGAGLFRRQGLAGPGFLGLAVAFPAEGRVRRDAVLAGVDRAAAAVPRAVVRQVRRVGAPFVESWIERESGQASVRWFPVFGLLVVGVVLFLYRSARALLVILLSLGAAVALGVAAGGLLGFPFTVVSALVPLTVMVTTVASLVYLHSRFVDLAPGDDLEAHRVRALANKFLPVTASSVAAVAGFGSLAVSAIRPVREMGLWTASGLALSWAVCFTLYPALQVVLRAPAGPAARPRTALYDRLAARLPAFTWRWRWPLVACSLLLSAAGAAALLGLPGRLAPMAVSVDSLAYVDPDLAIHRDMVFFRERVGGLNLARVWVRTQPGAAVDPEVLRGLDRFATALEGLPGVGAVVGPTTFLRMRRYLAGEGDRLPEDKAAFGRLAGDVEGLLLAEPELRAFLDVGTLASAQLTVTFAQGDEAGYRELARGVRAAWARAQEAVPALAPARIEVVGEALLQAKVGASLVPTLTESFALSAALIFAAFLVVFRSPAARLLAMIPSLFAILVTFLGLRLLGGSLNVATILIATTVLGTTENDQIHFFHHLQEGPRGDLDGELRHTLRVAGRAIVFATLINAAGFLGLAASGFPPLRQFGVVTAAAFLLALLGDFTALPASLWILRRQRPRP